jgi:hypothetical protein
MKSETPEMNGWADVIRSLSYWQITQLSLGLMTLMGLVIGLLVLAPSMFSAMIKELIEMNPEGPLTAMTVALLPVIPYVLPVLMLLLPLAYVLNRMAKPSTETGKNHG